MQLTETLGNDRGHDCEWPWGEEHVDGPENLTRHGIHRTREGLGEGPKKGFCLGWHPRVGAQEGEPDFRRPRGRLERQVCLDMRLRYL